MLSAVQQLTQEYPNAKIIMTGHSLGGVLATYAALDIKRFIAPQAHIIFYTFGSPRPGNDLFADFVMTVFPDGQYSRITHYKDLVPHIPPENQGYQHAGNEVWYNSSTYQNLTYLECENGVGLGENQNCSETYPLTVSIDDHLEYLGLKISSMCDEYELPNQPLTEDISLVKIDDMNDFFNKIKE